MRFESQLSHKLADVFDGVELGRFRRQRQERDVAWYGQLRRDMPSRLIEEKDGMCAWGDCNRDFLEMQSHGLAVAGGQDKPSAFPFGGADGAENIGRRRPLVVRRRRTRPTLGPAAWVKGGADELNRRADRLARKAAIPFFPPCAVAPLAKHDESMEAGLNPGPLYLWMVRHAR